MPHRASTSQPWRMQRSRYGLIGSECPACKKTEFPGRQVCRECGSETVEKVMNGKGKIESFTAIHTAPEGFESQTPYVVALVRLDEGPLITAQVVEPVEMGKSVKAVFRRLYKHGEDGILKKW